MMWPEFLKNMSASADVLAMAKVEVDLAAIPEGKNVSLEHPRASQIYIHTTSTRMSHIEHITDSGSS